MLEKIFSKKGSAQEEITKAEEASPIKEESKIEIDGRSVEIEYGQGEVLFTEEMMNEECKSKDALGGYSFLPDKMSPAIRMFNFPTSNMKDAADNEKPQTYNISPRSHYPYDENKPETERKSNDRVYIKKGELILLKKDIKYSGNGSMIEQKDINYDTVGNPVEIITKNEEGVPKKIKKNKFDENGRLIEQHTIVLDETGVKEKNSRIEHFKYKEDESGVEVDIDSLEIATHDDGTKSRGDDIKCKRKYDRQSGWQSGDTFDSKSGTKLYDGYMYGNDFSLI